MKTLTITLILLLIQNFYLKSQQLPERAPADPDYKLTEQELDEMQRNGIILPPERPLDSPWANVMSPAARDFPAVYDMRETPWLTSVKAQSSGGCWAYSVMGAVESRLLMLGLGEYDLSDNNLKYCHSYIPARSTNGNHWMASAYFARRSGPFHESDDPHPGGTNHPDNCPDSLTPLYYIHQARYTPPLDMDFTKQTVLDWGPVWSLMYYNANFFNITDNTYYYGGSHAVNHAGIVVGWNDTLQTAGGTGAWIVKNTYGPNWGDGGYYYISYNDSQFLKYNGYWPEVMEHDTAVHLYQYDEIGGYWGVGFDSPVGYGLVKFEGVEGITEITKIGTFVQYAGSGVEVKIYQHFDGQLSGLLASMDEVICELPGYYTLDLDSTVFIPEGMDFYVQIKYDSKNAANKWPVSVEDTIPTYSMPQLETGKYWIAPNPEIWPEAWYQVGHGTPFHYDLCIKAYAKKLPPVPAVLAFAGEDISIVEGETATLGLAQAENFSALAWSTSGDGTFDDSSLLHPTYAPGSQDIAEGTVTLTLSATPLPPLVIPETDQTTLTILRYPLVEIGYPEQQEKLCDAEVLVSGIAFDPDGNLNGVEVAVNDQEWVAATGTEEWSKTVALLPGINAIRSRSIDQTGLISTIHEVEVVYSVQSFLLPAGWSTISGYLIPDVADVELLFESVAGNLVVLSGAGGLYAPPPINTNTLVQWNPDFGYKVKMAAGDQLTFCGDVPVGNTLTLNSGFRNFPVLSNQSALLNEVFDDPLNDILYIFDLNHQLVYWPAGGIFTLHALHPGIGYQGYFLNPVTLNYPPHEGFFVPQQKSSPAEFPNAPWKIQPTGVYHLISIRSDALKNLGDGFIGVFDGADNCVGSVYFDGISGDNLLLVAYGDDGYSLTSNAMKGQPLHFKFYAEDEQRDLTVLFDKEMPHHDGMFVQNGLSAITQLAYSASGMEQENRKSIVRILPNPAHGKLTVTYPALAEAPIISIITPEGRLLLSRKGNYFSTHLDIGGFESGIYFIRIETAGEVYYEKLVVK
jgi:C1A family cysteine protease